MNFKVPPAPYAAWRPLVMSGFLICGGGLILSFSAGLLFLGLTSLSIPGNGSASLTMLVLSVGLIGLVLLLIPGIVLNIRSFFALSNSSITNRIQIPDKILIPLIIISWPIILFLGQLASNNRWASSLYIPVANIFAIGLPILLYVRISLNKLVLPGALRGWSIFGVSLISAPVLSIIFELLVFGIFLLGYFLYASSVPGLKDTLSTLASALQPGNTNQDDVIRIVANLAFAPGAMIAMLTTFSIAIPVIEETIKVSVIMLYLGRIKQPQEGFVLGILCGAAFALTESLGFASAGVADWTANAAVRATSALPHILNSGLLGWALVSAWKEARYLRLVGSFCAVILIHGIWNAISLGIAYSEFSQYVANAPFYFQYSYPWYAAWGVMVAGCLTGLIFNNVRMRISSGLENKAEV